MPPNRAFLVQPHLPLCEGPNAVYCRASRWCLPLGKVMGARYPDQVGGHKPCVPVVIVVCTCPRLGRFIVLGHDGGR